MVEQPAHGVYPEHWEADVVLRDGGTAHLRPISPGDADAVQAFHRAQSQNSIYLRFFTYKSQLSDKELLRFTNVDYRDRVAFVITMGRAILGIGRYDRLEDPLEAEVAFNIADRHQGRGLGSILLEHLAAAAWENGIRRFSAEILPENGKMLAVFSEAGYEVHRHFDSGVISLGFDIDPTEKSRSVMESREHRAEARSVAALLAPASVAVIGSGRSAAEPAGGRSEASRLVEHILAGGYSGELFLVISGPATGADADGTYPITAYRSLSEVPGPVDLAVIAVDYADVPAVVAECGAAGVKGVLVITGGFADDGEHGLARQRSLVRQARANGMRLIGPASLGLANTRSDVLLNASLAPHLPAAGGLGLFSQSAALGVSLHAAAVRRRLGLSSMLSAGNRADVSGNDLMQFWEDDGQTSACALYLESIGNPRKFSRIARRLSRSKPVIVAKSDVMGLRLPPGHAVRTTAAPAGALDAMLRQAGVLRVGTIEELVDVAQLVLGAPLPAGGSVLVLSNSLALASVVADSLESHGMVVQDIVADLRPGAQDQAAAGLRERLLESLGRESVHAAVVALLPDPELPLEPVAAVLHECSQRTGKPVAAAFPGILDASIAVDGLSGAGLPCYSSPGSAVAALAAVVRYAQWRQREQGDFPHPAGIDSDAVSRRLEILLQSVRGDALVRLGPDEAAGLLKLYGITVLESAPFTTAEEAVAEADRLGWPVALKTTDATLRHRLDLGGVQLNIDDAGSLRRNIARMTAVLRPYGSFGMEIQAMAAVGQSCTLRAIEDPLLGPVLSFGLAGDAVNLLDDWAHRVPPLTQADVADLVRSPRAARKLFGYQGLPAVDLAALEDLVARLAVLKDEHPEIALVEFNPVLAGPAGLTVLAADVRIANPAQRTDSARRALLS
ncbi:GNAT family N-acetyltransferase [Paenarthrobacter sp. Z7-10]|uniref:bifunctional acetate--CoA ligase family protein/GNAT family N-acetyltransferase n=1 Tax=Paenarthrobacter sp. Z7-10 TaxID=2787635 RepID=UPI0022A9B1F4|nr:GNAT family N-acetyltransferase [Paenarthrobacter sp. Z7-10]MCZ2403769.1 GNAT family N-acetyltransferase [Paenarthrobacter sp. Z7-10]